MGSHFQRREAMNNRLRYELRGLAYWANCANPFRNTVRASNLPLGLKIDGYKRDAVGRGLYRRGYHELGLTTLLVERFSGTRGHHFLDLGANIGYFSCLLGKLAGPTGKIISVEAEPRNFELLERNLRNNSIFNAKAFCCALGAEDGVAKMGIYKAANRGRHSLVDLASCKEFIEVPLKRLDDLLGADASTNWSLIKMDVEGYEPYVLQGGPRTFARAEMLAMEYAPSYWRSAGIEPKAVFERLAQNFNRIYRFENDQLVQTTSAECEQSPITLDLIFEK